MFNVNSIQQLAAIIEIDCVRFISKKIKLVDLINKYSLPKLKKKVKNILGYVCIYLSYIGYA